MAVKEVAKSSISEEKNKALKLAIEKIEKDFGKGSIMKLGDRPSVNVESIPTGSLALDVALGIGGIPRGRIIEIYGPESSGKTTLALHIVAECQKKGGIAAYVDAEHALDPEYSRNLGVMVDELLISQPDTGEQALDITEELVRSGAVDMVGLGFNLTKATGHTKVMNFASNLSSLLVFALAGQVLLVPGLVMGAGQWLGARAGAGMVIRHGTRFIRPVFLVVVLALTAKLLFAAYVR